MQVVSVNIGQARPLPGGRGELTGLYKEPVASLRAEVAGVVGDTVVDTRHHGGPDKALCVYCAEHYPVWAARYPSADWRPGAFGENLTLTGLTEEALHLGDILTVGEVVAQVSQPRGPCHKLAARHGLRDFVKVCCESTWTGWYLRVLTPGAISPGDPVTVTKMHPARLTIAEANRIRYAPEPTVAELERILAVDALSAAWRADVTGLLRRAS